MKTVDMAEVSETLAALREELARLSKRVAALESMNGVKQAAPVVSKPPQAAGLSEELLLVISAAVAAFLGKKAHVRQIRLIGGESWAQQGRATIQASHVLPLTSHPGGERGRGEV